MPIQYDHIGNQDLFSDDSALLPESVLKAIGDALFVDNPKLTEIAIATTKSTFVRGITRAENRRYLRAVERGGCQLEVLGPQINDDSKICGATPLTNVHVGPKLARNSSK